MQTQSPFGPLLGLPSMLPSPAAVAAAAAAATGQPPVSLATFPSAFAAFASQIRSTQLQTLLQSQIQALNGGSGPPGGGGGGGGGGTPLSRNNYGGLQHGPGGKVRGTTEYPLRKRVGGSTVKTAKVWRYFDELPTIEQAAECRICRKKIKATNSSTTGMIRHLRSCHVQEYQLVQEARQNSMIVKMEEKARAKLLREMNEKVISTGIENNHPLAPLVDVKKETTSSSGSTAPPESQKSPSASSSASDTASSASSSHFLNLPAPVPIKPLMSVMHQQQQQQQQLNLKSEATEVEEEIIDVIMKPTDLSVKLMQTALPSEEIQKKIEDDHKIHMQIALMLLLDQQPSHLIDRPGFRSLFKFLLPDYHLPTGDLFQTTIVPQLLNHMKQQIAGIFNGVNGGGAGANGNVSSEHLHRQSMTSHINSTTATTTSSQSTSSYEEVSVNESSAGPNVDDDQMMMMEEEEEEEPEENVEIEDDTSSASSSVDTDTCDTIASFIHYIGNDAFPHDELISLLSVVTNIFTYFSTRPHVQTHLQMTLSPPTSPPLVQQLRFVASNLSRISDYIRHTPDMQLLPLAANQETLLERLVDHIDQL